MIQAAEQYKHGLQAYRARQWESARKFFTAALDVRPDDAPSRTMLDRCAAYQTDPPPSDWDGAFSHDIQIACPGMAWTSGKRVRACPLSFLSTISRPLVHLWTVRGTPFSIVVGMSESLGDAASSSPPPCAGDKRAVMGR